MRRTKPGITLDLIAGAVMRYGAIYQKILIRLVLVLIFGAVYGVVKLVAWVVG